MESVTQLQSELHRLSELFFGTVGELQRDAPPVSVKGEELVEPPSTSYSAEERAKGFAQELAQASRNLEQFIDGLPGPVDEAGQLRRIAALQDESHAMDEELRLERARSEGKLRQVHEMYAALAEGQLMRRQEQLAAGGGLGA